MPRQADRQQQIDVGDDRIGFEEGEGSGGIDLGHLRHVGEAEHRDESFASRDEVIGKRRQDRPHRLGEDDQPEALPAR